MAGLSLPPPALLCRNAHAPLPTSSPSNPPPPPTTTRINAAAEDAAPSGSVFKYSPTANRWTALPRPIPTPRSDACAAVLDGKLYVMGGYSKDYAQNLGGEVLDLSTGRWASVPDGMTGRGDVECAVLEAAAGRGACVAVLGGWGPNEEFSSLAECFEPAANSWRKLASMTRARGESFVF